MTWSNDMNAVESHAIWSLLDAKGTQIMMRNCWARRPRLPITTR